MNKTIITFSMIIFSIIGGYVPVLFGDSMLGGWSILGGVIGGIVGIWLGAVISKRYF